MLRFLAVIIFALLSQLAGSKSYSMQKFDDDKVSYHKLLRLHGAMGWNIGNQPLYGGESNSYFYGGQIFPLPANSYYVRIGLDFNHMRAMKPNENGKPTTYNFFNAGAFMEIELEYLIIQSGYMMYFPTGDNNITEFGFMMAMGGNVPLSDNFHITLLARMDLMNERHINFSGVLGLTLSIGKGGQKKESQPSPPAEKKPNQSYLDGQGYGAI